MAEPPAIISCLLQLGKLWSSHRFRSFSEKMEPSKKWFAHAMVCQLQSVLNSFVEVAQNYNFQKTVEAGNTPPPSILLSCFIGFDKLLENTRGAMNGSSSSFLFSSQPLLFTKGWLVASGSYSFPSSWPLTPCKNFAEEGKSCAFGRSCDYEHKLYPKGYTKKVQALICKWVKDTSSVKFASFVRESDRNVTFVPRNNNNNNEDSPNNDTNSQTGTNTESPDALSNNSNDSTPSTAT